MVLCVLCHYGKLSNQDMEMMVLYAFCVSISSAEVVANQSSAHEW